MTGELLQAAKAAERQIQKDRDCLQSNHRALERGTSFFLTERGKEIDRTLAALRSAIAKADGEGKPESNPADPQWSEWINRPYLKKKYGRLKFSDECPVPWAKVGEYEFQVNRAKYAPGADALDVGWSSTWAFRYRMDRAPDGFVWPAKEQSNA